MNSHWWCYYNLIHQLLFDTTSDHRHLREYVHTVKTNRRSNHEIVDLWSRILCLQSLFTRH